MTRVICCRHGQSVANAGGATADPLSIPLTDLGRQQAEEVALRWELAPNLIVVSPAERARATAAPTIRRFPHVRQEVWPIHEFTYLSPARCAGTTGEQRRDWVAAYWAKADPTWVDGYGAESFVDFIDRVDTTCRRLTVLNIKAAGAALLFGHGQFINAMRWRLLDSANSSDMLSYRNFDLANPVSHCEPVAIAASDASSFWPKA